MASNSHAQSLMQSVLEVKVKPATFARKLCNRKIVACRPGAVAASSSRKRTMRELSFILQLAPSRCHVLNWSSNSTRFQVFTPPVEYFGSSCRMLMFLQRL